MTFWTDERVEQVRALWTEGLSGSQIARVLGGVTRNAVISKVHRLGLPERPHTVNRHASWPARTPKRLAKPPKEEPRLVVEEPPVVLEDGSFATILTINDRMCRWPIGDPSENEFHFCGRKPEHGSPYCEAHARKAYQPPQERRGTGIATKSSYQPDRNVLVQQPRW